jgi:hypothetical protein
LDSLKNLTVPVRIVIIKIINNEQM